ncbi:MAG TPA: hypothetical protein VFR24_13210 [Candidatus Angelobacter sp.]|nr:hypothetical protein [Candidatus Angelobacter sp.]
MAEKPPSAVILKRFTHPELRTRDFFAQVGVPATVLLLNRP